MRPPMPQRDTDVVCSLHSLRLKASECACRCTSVIFYYISTGYSLSGQQWNKVSNWTNTFNNSLVRDVIFLYWMYCVISFSLTVISSIFVNLFHPFYICILVIFLCLVHSAYLPFICLFEDCLKQIEAEK